MCAIRWKIEQFPRRINQLIGRGYCQCRSAKIPINHIDYPELVWGFKSKFEPIKLVKQYIKLNTGCYQII